jgi:hypothetical protein
MTAIVSECIMNLSLRRCIGSWLGKDLAFRYQGDMASAKGWPAPTEFTNG